MKNLKLKWKLLVSYGIIFLLLLLLGLTSISVLNMMSKKNIEYAEEIVPVVEEIGIARRNMLSVRRYLLNAIIAGDKEDYQRIKEAMTTDREALYSSLDAIETINEEYTPQVETIREKLESVAQYNSEIMTLSENFEDATAKDRAYDIYLNTYAPVFTEAADQIVALNEEIDADVLSQEELVKQVKGIAILIVSLIFLVAVVAVVVCTGLMLRYILVPARKLMEGAKAPPNRHPACRNWRPHCRIFPNR